MVDFKKASQENKVRKDAAPTTQKQHVEAPAQAEIMDAVPNLGLQVQNEQPVPVPAQTSAVAKYQVSEALAERLIEAREALETYDDIKFPVIRCKDGKFILGEGIEPVDELEGIILYTKQNNVLFEKPYKAGVVAQPDCFSPDGKTPNVEKPKSPSCKICKFNEFGSSRLGTQGKACRNIRLVFVLLRDSILPSVLRVPPSSLKIVDAYVLNTTTTKGSYFNVMTKISTFKKDEAQTHFNLKFQPTESVEGQGKHDMKTIRDMWLERMKNVVAEYEDAEVVDPDADVQPQGTTTVETGRAF